MKKCMFVLITFFLMIWLTACGSDKTDRNNIGLRGSGQYAFTLSVYGNADMNDVLDEKDLAYLHEIIQGNKKQTQLADANQDGLINEADISHVKAMIAGDQVRLNFLDNLGVKVALDTPVNSLAALFFGALRPAIFLTSTAKITGIGSRIPTTHKKVNMLELRARPGLLDLAQIGTTNDPSQEAIVSLDPDVIFGSPHTDIDTAKTVSQNTGVPFIYSVPSYFGGFKSEDGAYETWRRLSLVLGKNERSRAEKLIQYCDQKLAQIEKITAEIPAEDQPRVYFINSDITDTIKDYEPIEIAGGRNVADQMSSQSWWGGGEVSKEQIIAWDPQIILIHHYSKDKSFIHVAKVLSDTDLQTVSAIKNKRVYNVKAWYGGWDSAVALCDCFYLAKIFHPQLFRELNVEDECNKILEQFYGLPKLWDWMLENCGNYQVWK